MTERFDDVVVGGGHNGLVAAAYLALAGRRVVVLEALDHTGGAAVGTRPFPGIDARLSRYSYLVSLLPGHVVRDLGLRFSAHRRRISSYTPYEDDGAARGLLIDSQDRAATRAALGADADGWERLYGLTAAAAPGIFDSLTQPLRSRAEMRSLMGPEAFEMLVERPIGELIERELADDVVRGIVLTDGLIGTFARANDPSLAQNRCFLYHVIGNGTGDWDVPVGGMRALTDGLADAVRQAGGEIRTRAAVHAIASDGREATVTYEGGEIACANVLAGCAPRTLARLLGRPEGRAIEGSQLKLNLLVRRLPTLRSGESPERAFAGTFHVSEGYAQLEQAYAEAARGELPARPPSELYCHTLSDPSILSPALRRRGWHTLTLFGLHAPARLFRADNEAARDELARRTLAELDRHLAEPIAGCLATDEHGEPCLEVRSPLDLEAELGLPGGNIFHRELQWPFAERAADVGRWGVETDLANVLICGAGARRGGAVSGISGHNAAMAILNPR